MAAADATPTMSAWCHPTVARTLNVSEITRDRMSDEMDNVVAINFTGPLDSEMSRSRLCSSRYAT